MAVSNDYMVGLAAKFDATDGSRVALVVDMPRAFADSSGALVRRLIDEGLDEGPGRPVTAMLDRVAATVVPAVTMAAERVRATGGRVIMVRFGSAHVGPSSIAPTVRTLADIVWSDGDVRQAEPIVQPAPSDLFVDRIAASAFTGTALDALLRNLEIDTVATCGVYTDGSIASTARDAADFDYRSVVLADGCAALDPFCHDASLRNHARLLGPVLEAASFVDAIIEPMTKV